MGAQRTSRWVAVLAAVVVLSGNAAALAINVATGVRARWPLGLDAVRMHPFRWSVGFTVIVLVAAVVGSWLQQRTSVGRALQRGSTVVSPEWVVERPIEVDQVVAALCRRGGSRVGITTALHGAGGFGKTTVAKLACLDRRVRRRFRNRVYLVTLGRDVRSTAAIAAKVNDVIKLAAAQDARFTDPELAGAHLGSLLDAGPRILLVIDDVWYPEQLAPFLDGGSRCARLITTRMPALLTGHVVAVKVDQMSAAQSRQVLTWDLPDMSPGVVNALLAATGQWPLLLRLVNKILANAARTTRDVSAAGVELCRHLQAAGPTAVDVLTGEARQGLDINVPQERARAVRTTIEASTNLLDRQGRERLAELAVFAEDESIPLRVIVKLWRATAGVDVLHAQQLCARLDELALITTTTADDGGVTMHDVIREFFQQELGAEQLTALHGTLLDAVAADLPAAVPTGRRIDTRRPWWLLGGRASYLWDHLVDHLLCADRAEEAETVACDLRWISTRLERFNASAAYADLALIDTPRGSRMRASFARTMHLLAPTEPTHAVIDVLHSRLAGDPDWGPQIVAMTDSFGRSRLVNRWPLPDLPDPALRCVLGGHTGWVTAAAIAPDGTWLATAGTDDTIRIWHSTNGQMRSTLTGPTGQVNMISIGPDSTWLVTASGGGKVLLWDVDRGLVRTTFADHAGPLHAVVVAPDGSWLATAGRKRTVSVWDVATGRRLATLIGHTGPVNDLAIASDGKWLATASSDGTARIWDTTTWETGAFFEHDFRLHAVAIAPDGAWLATSGDDPSARIWHTTTRQVRTVLASSSESVDALAIAADGTWLLSAGSDGTTRTWDFPTGKARTSVIHMSNLDAAAIAPDGTWFATAGSNGTTRIFDSTADENRAKPNFQGLVETVAAAPDGTWLATGGSSVRIWDAASGRVRTTLDLEPSRAIHGYRVEVSPDGTWLATALGATVQIWDVATWRMRATFGDGWGGRALAISPDGTWLAVSSFAQAKLWNVDSGQSFGEIGIASTLSPVLISPDGTWLATGDHQAMVRIWDIASNVSETGLAGHDGPIYALAVAPDGSWLASGSGDGTVRIWSVAQQRSRAILTGHKEAVRALATTADGNWLASAGDDGTVRIWNTSTWRICAMMRLYNAATSCCWIPKTTALAVGGPAGLYMFDFFPGVASPARPADHRRQPTA